MTRYPFIPMEARLEQVRKMLDEGKTFDEIMHVTGLSEATVRVYCYRVKRENEEYRAKRIGIKHRKNRKRYSVAVDSSLNKKLVQQAEQFRMTPGRLLNRIVSNVINDNLVKAVVGED